MTGSSRKVEGIAKKEKPTAAAVPGFKMVWGAGMAYCPLGSLAFRIFKAMGLILEPSQATCVPPANVVVLATGLFGGQNAAPSAAAVLTLPNCAGRVTVEGPWLSTPSTWRVCWNDRK